MSATATASPTTHARKRATPRAPFQRFLDDHREAVLGFLRAMVGPDDADDCFQETFIAALRAYDRMDGRHPRAWVMTIARRKAIDHHRARARRPEPRATCPSMPRRPPAAGGVGDLDGEVWAAVAGLPDAQRAAVALRYAADLPTARSAPRWVHRGGRPATGRRRLAALRENIDEQEAKR